MALLPIPPSAPFVPKKYPNTYWVDPVIGNDSNPGNSIERPWKTLAYAIGGADPAADTDSTIILMPGTYTESAITINNYNFNIVGNGAANSNLVSFDTPVTIANSSASITFQNVNMAEDITISATGSVSFYGCFFSGGVTVTKSGSGTTSLIDCNAVQATGIVSSAGTINLTNSTAIAFDLTGGTANFNECTYIRLTSFSGATLNGFNTTFQSITAGGAAITSTGTNTLKLFNCRLLDSTGALTGAILSSGTTYTFNDVVFSKSASTLSGTLATSYSYTNYLSSLAFTAPANSVNPIPYYDGTKLVTDAAVTHLGYNALTDTVYSGAIRISGATTSTAWFTNTTAQSTTSGAGMSGFCNDGTAMVSGNRLGFYTLGGAKDSSNNTNNSSAIEAFATENWSSTAAGSSLVFSTTGNTTTTRNNVLTLGQDKSATFTGSVSATLYGQATASLSNFATGGAIGTAADTVDIYSIFNINQTTAGQNLTIPSPTVTSVKRSITIVNTGTASFTVNTDTTIATSASANFVWNGSNWIKPTPAVFNGGTVTAPITVNYTGSGANTAVSYAATGSNTRGGTEYLDFLQVTNTTSGATNPNKFMRINNVGTLEILNSAYTASIVAIDDSGNLTMSGGVNTSNTTTSNAVTAFRAGSSAISNVALEMPLNSAIRDVYNGASNMYFDVSTGGSTNGTFQFRSSNAYTTLLTLNTAGANFQGLPIQGQTPYVGRSAWNVALDTEVVVGAFTFRISNQGGVFPQVKSTSGGGINTAFNVLAQVSGATLAFNQNSGFNLTTYATVYSTHGMDTAGDMVSGMFMDKTNSKIYRVSFIRGDNGTTTGYNIIVEQLL